MPELLLKKNGAIASGSVYRKKDDVWIAQLLVQDAYAEFRQIAGPEKLASMQLAKKWIHREAALHGFTEHDFDIAIEDWQEVRD